METIKCPYCDKVFEGSTLNQIEKQLLIHKINKHPERIEIKEKKK